MAKFGGRDERKRGVTGAAFEPPFEGVASYWRTLCRGVTASYAMRRAAMCSGAYAARVRLCAVAHTPNVFLLDLPPIDA